MRRKGKRVLQILVDGLRSHAEVLGGGEPLLLLHGWGPSSVTLEKHLLPLGQTLSAQHRVYMLEFPGHGISHPPSGDWGVAEYAEWTIKAMDALAISQAAVVAHSFGGRIALHLAANVPHRLTRLVLTGCAGLKPKRTFESWVRARLFKAGRLGLKAAGMLPPFQKGAAEWTRRLREELASADYLATPEAMRGSFSRVVSQDARPLLSRIRQPVLLVWGEKDTATPLWMGEALFKGLPDARLLVYEADDHWAYRNQLSRFANAVDAFLQEGMEE